jgi:hypothetical protein
MTNLLDGGLFVLGLYRPIGAGAKYARCAVKNFPDLDYACLGSLRW